MTAAAAATSGPPDESASTAVVVGASGGIGQAFVAQLRSRGWSRILALSRRAHGVDAGDPVLFSATFDLEDEASIAAAAATAAGLPPVRLVIVATGLLHDDRLRPEKSIGALDPAALSRSFAVNTIGPALVLKHFAPQLPRRGRSVIALLSARVGSIADNRLGGWYGYRASKAALNMVIRTASIELARTRPEALCIGLHPGTVDTALSAPFATGAGAGARTRFTPAQSATAMLEVLDGLQPADSGRVFAWDGTIVPP